MYKSILKAGIDEFIEKRSRFIGYSFFVESEEEALQKIDEIKEKHRDATHNCWAYIIGQEGLIQRYSDDGEPQGTAGVPILEVLKKEELRNTVIIVTRYFGGTLLGAGGLVRAYSKGAAISIDAAGRVVRKSFLLRKLKYDYTNHGKILNHLLKKGYTVLKEEYSDKVEIYLHDEKDSSLTEELMDMTGGNVEIENLKEDILPTVNKKIIYEV
ncbi:MAG: YigZ family protein [Tissierellia bacterium]|nr:YigZ family protein [Tissierellia bacterium]